MLQATEFHEQGNKENCFLLLIASNKDLTKLGTVLFFFFPPHIFLFFSSYTSQWNKFIYQKVLRWSLTLL